jgi:ligand-binding SRPBCC domain-containing protein
MIVLDGGLREQTTKNLARQAREQVTWRARHLGRWRTLTSRITAYDRPIHFRDSMVDGAFARFDHDHFFDDGGAGTTLMRDVFDFSTPWGIAGRVAEVVFLTRYLVRLLERRNRVVKSVAESNEWHQFVTG